MQKKKNSKTIILRLFFLSDEYSFGLKKNPDDMFDGNMKFKYLLLGGPVFMSIMKENGLGKL